MSDRSDVFLTIPKRTINYKRLKQTLEADLGCSWEDFLNDSYAFSEEDFIYSLELTDVNYAEPLIEKSLLKYGIPFSFTHTAGDEYSDGFVIFDGKNHSFLPTNVAGNVQVDIDEISLSFKQGKNIRRFFCTRKNY